MKRLGDLLPSAKEVARRAEIEPTFQVDALFTFKKLEMGDDLIWRIKVVVKKMLPQTFREYDAIFSLNETPYQTRIDDMEKRKIAISEEPTLFKEERVKQMRGCDMEIGDIERELADARRDTPSMEFKAIVEALAYKDGDTVLTMIVSAEVINDFNANRTLLGNYKIELIRE